LLHKCTSILSKSHITKSHITKSHISKSHISKIHTSKSHSNVRCSLFAFFLHKCTSILSKSHSNVRCSLFAFFLHKCTSILSKSHSNVRCSLFAFFLHLYSRQPPLLPHGSCIEVTGKGTLHIPVLLYMLTSTSAEGGSQRFRSER